MITGRAPARTALVGNPSDGFGGAVLTLAVANWEATVELRSAPSAVADRVEGPEGLVPIVDAARRVFRGRIGPVDAAHLSVTTTIPREVGLAGSSAVVIATLDASARQAGIELDGRLWPSLALHVETAELGIPGGLQDRVAQVWGGLVLCDARRASTTVVDGLETGTYRRLAAEALPDLAVTWLPTAGESSAVSQGRLRTGAGRLDRVETFARLAALAVDAADALDGGRPERLGPAMVATMAARRELVALRPDHADLVERVAGTGAAANYSGSGGAVVSTVPADGLDALRAAVEPAGASVERLRVAPPRSGIS